MRTILGYVYGFSVVFWVSSGFRHCWVLWLDTDLAEVHAESIFKANLNSGTSYSGWQGMLLCIWG